MDITKAYKKVINNEKKRTGLTVLTAYKQLESQNNLTEDKIRVANILGWSVEFVSVKFYLIFFCKKEKTIKLIAGKFIIFVFFFACIFCDITLTIFKIKFGLKFKLNNS